MCTGVGTFLARNGGRHVLRTRDDALLPAAFHKLDGGFHLRAHGPGRELAGRQIRSCVGDRDGIQPLLVGPAKPYGGAVHAGDDDQFLRMHTSRQQAGSAILIHHSFDAHQPVAFPGHGDASTAAGDHHHAGLEQARDRSLFHDGGGIVGGHWPIESPDYRDVAGTVRRYAPHIEAAATAGAKLLVLPEVAVYVVNELSRVAWIDAVTAWARTYGVTIIAPFFDASVPRNTLCVVEPTGVAFTYDKQHPGRGIEPPRTSPMPPGPHRSSIRAWALSTVICVDLDYGDLVPPVRGAGGVLCAPSNDWLDGFEELHHRTAVWAAARTGATVVRATGHGISAAFDGTGRVLARASSQFGPVVLVVDAPIGNGP